MLAILKRLVTWLIGLGSARRPRAPASEWSLGDLATSVHDTFIDNRRVRYLDAGRGTPMLLLHGMGCCWQWWSECLPGLTATHRVIAIDLPGFGDSDPLPSPSTMDDFAETVRGLILELHLPPVVLVGHSMGGLVAINLAQRHAELVERLVLLDAGGVPMSERRLRIVLRVLRSAQRAFSHPAVLRLLATNRRARRLMLKGAMRNPDAMSDELAAIVMPKLAAPGFIDAIAASAAAVRETAPESISVPTTLIWGEHDRFAPLSAAREMLSRLPDGRLYVIPDAGHTPQVEAPELCTQYLLRDPRSDDQSAALAEESR